MSVRACFAACTLLFAAGCAGRQAEEPPSVTAAHSPIVKACPLGVPETRMNVEDSAEGVVVTFTTTPDRVEELRGRVADQAAIHGPEQHVGAGHEGRHGTAHGHGLRLWELPPVRAASDDVHDGARLHVFPLDAKDLAAVRASVRERVAKLESRDCP